MSRTHAVLSGVAVAAVIAAVVFAGLYVTKDSATGSAAPQRCGDRIYGHISSLTAKGDGYAMRFDPAWFTSGVTANTAAAEDGAVEPGEPVPNDNYRIDEGHRLLTYLVPSKAQVTVLARHDDTFHPTPVTVSQLSQLVNGEKPIELFEPLDTGAWIRVNVDTVCTLDQQYLP
jgi:hypothetical protein